MSVSISGIEQLAINTIRTLSMDAVQAANSGHPGTPMALAPLAYTLWNEVLQYDPQQPLWPNRDRFVLSCGHASMLLYSLIHLAGIRKVGPDGQPLEEASIRLEDIRNFRQLHSPCAGHPEFGEAAGIETTTGPLGQGVGNSVGMAIASKFLAARYNRPDFDLFDFNVFAVCSDGDLMEGVGCEAASIAGHLQLSNLCWIYDDNHITIEGETDLAFSEDVPKRFEGLGWHVYRVKDANNLESLRSALQSFQETTDRPTLIALRSIIGYGSPNKSGSHDAHGAPLGEEEVRLTKEYLGWPADQPFHVPAEVVENFANGMGQRGREAYEAWSQTFERYEQEHAEQAKDLKTLWAGEVPEGWDREIPSFEADAKGMATRVSSGKVLNGFAANVPWLLGGSADLAPSTKTLLESDDAGHFSAGNYAGRNLHFGVREHSMAAICNGLSLCGLRPYGATFFVFTDYMRPSMRLSSIMKQGVTYVLTHDSIGLGEDGPTHQPIEHLAACRAIPGLHVYRPGDANEVAEAYRSAIPNTTQPAAIVLTRQNVPTLDRSRYAPAEGARKGGYILADPENGKPAAILMGTGSELAICVEAYEQLVQDGVPVRLVSMPCCELFDDQGPQYVESVLPVSITARVAVEAGVRQSWDKYLGPHGRFVGLCSFGASGPYEELYQRYELTPARVVQEVKQALGG